MRMLTTLAVVLTWTLKVIAIEKVLTAGYHRFPTLLDATLEELVVGLEAKDFTSVDLVNAYISRIYEVNATLHTVIEINPDAHEIAKTLDCERSNGTVRGPLHGIPILIKDNIATADKMNNTAGSYALVGATVPRDATVAGKLRDAGAILLGKTALSQWANWRSSNSSSGWNARSGQNLGAYYPNQNPSGSSSGSGVASSLGLALASLGSETDGSILSPSGYNNLVGVKPTVGLTSRSLVIPISEHQDTVGPMARTVKDAAYVLPTIAGMDEHDNYTSAIPFNGTLPDYVAACNFNALRGKRIGVPRNSFDQDDESTEPILAAFDAALEVLKAAGATVVEDTNYTAFDEYLNSSAETFVLQSDFTVNVAQYLAQLNFNPNNITTLVELRDFTQTFPAEGFPNRNTAQWDEGLALNFTQSDAQAWEYYQRDLFLGGEGGILGALKTYNLDAIVTPTIFASGISAIIGGPVVTVPLGKYPRGTPVRYNSRGDLVSIAPNIPFGISFSGDYWSEAELIGFAYAFEQRTYVRKHIKPVIQPVTELWDVVEQ